MTSLQKNHYEVLEDKKTHTKKISIILNNVTDPANIGGILRLADAAKIQEILFLGNITDEIHGKKMEAVARSTNNLYTIQHIESLDNIKNNTENELIVLEYTSHSKEYHTFSYNNEKHIYIVVGSEKHGVDENVLEIVESHIHIPMYGVNSSMNVVQATSIAIFHILHS